MENRRGFIKQAVAGLGFVGLFLKDLFIEPVKIASQFEEKQEQVSGIFGKTSMKLDGDYPSMPKVKPPKSDDIKFGKLPFTPPKTLHFDPTVDYINVAGMWFHIVVLASNSKTHLYVDGKLVKTISKEYNSELANKLIVEYFLNADSIPRTS